MLTKKLRNPPFDKSFNVNEAAGFVKKLYERDLDVTLFLSSANRLRLRKVTLKRSYNLWNML